MAVAVPPHFVGDDAITARLLAERAAVYELDTTDNPHVRRAADGVDAILLDTEAAPDWDDDDRRRFQQGLVELGFDEVFAEAGITLYERNDPQAVASS